MLACRQKGRVQIGRGKYRLCVSLKLTYSIALALKICKLLILF